MVCQGMFHRPVEMARGCVVIQIMESFEDKLKINFEFYEKTFFRFTKINVALTAFLRANGAGLAEQGCNLVNKTLTTFIRNTIKRKIINVIIMIKI